MYHLGIILGVILGLQPLHDAGYRGAGKTIAVIDCGFYRANDSSVFKQQQIIGYYDLVPDTVRKADLFSDRGDIHGTEVLSTMLMDSSAFVGTAPDAKYILFRTENIYQETWDETLRLQRAMHMADSLGADIITISLGYSVFEGADSIYNFTHDDLDGQSSLSRTATEMARRGHIVCIAAGNEGSKPWHKIMLPADADSVLTVGAVDSVGKAADFSSYGPSIDDRVKPEVSAIGVQTRVYQPATNRIIRGNGTSFATPEIAGMAACLWQALPGLSAMEIRRLIIESASLYPGHDDQRGYGIPDAYAAWQAGKATALEHIPSDEQITVKEVENGQVIIRRGNARYSVLGEKIE